MADKKKPEIMGTEIVATSKLFDIERVDLRFSNGAERQFERLRPKNRGAVMVVPLLDDNTVLMVREYAAGVERYDLSLPKGVVDEGETHLEAAQRELMEETGYGAKNMEIFTKLTSLPAYFYGAILIVLARDLYKESLQGDEPEEIEVISWKLDNLEELVAREDVSESRSIAALYMVRDFMSKKS